MTSRTGQFGVRFASFGDFEAYEAGARGWTSKIRKLDVGPFSAHLVQVEAARVRLSYSRISSVLELQGEALPGFHSFGLPMPASSPALWCGRATSARTVSVYDLSGAFEAFVRPGFETAVLSVHPETLAALGEDLGIGTPAELLEGFNVSTCSDEPMLAVRRSLQHIVALLAREPHRAGHSALLGALSEDLPAQLLTSLTARRAAPRPVGPHLRGRALRRALAYVREHPCEPLRVNDLCRATGASERTLRRAFVEKLGVPPKAYLLARRLNGVRRELRHSTRGDSRVNEAAHNWGFWHMGQLAADYRRWFGEYPSKTLARSAR